MVLGHAPTWAPLLVFAIVAAVLAPLPLLWAVETNRTRRWRQWALRRWMGRPSARHVGVGSRRELLHLPVELEAIAVEAQRIRRGLVPLVPLREDSQWAVWAWRHQLETFEQRHPHALETIGVSSNSVSGRLRAALGEPSPLRQLMRIDLELWSFIRAARRGCDRGYR